jgi:hemerythrin
MISFDVARAWHEIYTLRLHLLLDGIGEGIGCIDVVCDANACELGHWIQGAVARRVGDGDLHRQLQEAHERFHRCAYDVVFRYTQGDKLGAKQMAANEMMTASAAVLAVINALEREWLRLGLTDASAALAEVGGASAAPLDQCVWNETLRIGLPVIDAQHRMLTELVDKLIARPKAKIDSEQASEIFFKVSRLVEIHFETEEGMMRHCGVPADLFERHRQAHNRILDECAQISVQVMAGRSMTVAEVFPMLRNMIVGHIVEYDLALKDYFQPASVS